MSAQVQSKVVLLRAMLDETPQGELIFRGVVDPESLKRLKVGDYQRDIQPKSTIDALKRAMDKGSVPDIELGMRGGNFKESSPGHIELLDAVYIIDGLQRVTAGLEKLYQNDKIPPHLGAVVHVNTVESWERERFRIVNVERVKLSPNVLLRNWHVEYKVMEMLLGLNEDKSFVMKGKVSWRQNMTREELITALTLSKVVGRLHTHISPGRSSRIDELVPSLQRIYDKVGVRVLKDNIKRFFEVVDTAWGIRRIAFKEGSIYIRSNFLLALAFVFSSHLDFWEDNRLVVDKSIVTKLGQFPYNDPQVASLSSGSSKALEMLYILLRNHINSGKRTRRLRPRNIDEATEMSLEERSSDESNTEEAEELVPVGAG